MGNWVNKRDRSKEKWKVSFLFFKKIPEPDLTTRLCYTVKSVTFPSITRSIITLHKI